jgi:hypothetical protein
MLEDGRYDVFIVDATADDATADDGAAVDRPDGDGSRWVLELTVLAGAHRGEVVTVRAAGLRGGEADLIGMPGTLTVVNGEPSLRVDA